MEGTATRVGGTATKVGRTATQVVVKGQPHRWGGTVTQVGGHSYTGGVLSKQTPSCW